jgi:hypothetical protein
MRDLVRLLRQCLVVIEPRRVGIEPEVELILRVEIEARPSQSIVAQLHRRRALGEIARMRGRCG